MLEPSHPDTTLLPTRDLVEHYITVKAAAGRAKSTLAGYRWKLSPLIKHFEYLPLDPVVLQEFIGAHATTSGKAPGTLKDAFARVREFYNWLVARKILPRDCNPILDMERPSVRKPPLPRFLSVEQLRRVIEVSKAPWERALILVLVDSGPRIGELQARTKDDLTDGGLYLYGKTGGRMLPLSWTLYKVGQISGR